MSQAFDVAVLGATGLVGQTMIELLEERDFPVNRLYPLASKRSAGSTVSFKGEDIEVLDADDFDWSLVQFGFFSAGGSICAVSGRGRLHCNRQYFRVSLRARYPTCGARS